MVFKVILATLMALAVCSHAQTTKPNSYYADAAVCADYIAQNKLVCDAKLPDGKSNVIPYLCGSACFCAEVVCPSYSTKGYNRQNIYLSNTVQPLSKTEETSSMCVCLLNPTKAQTSSTTAIPIATWNYTTPYTTGSWGQWNNTTPFSTVSYNFTTVPVGMNTSDYWWYWNTTTPYTTGSWSWNNTTGSWNQWNSSDSWNTTDWSQQWNTTGSWNQWNSSDSWNTTDWYQQWNTTGSWGQWNSSDSWNSNYTNGWNFTTDSWSQTNSSDSFNFSTPTPWNFTTGSWNYTDLKTDTTPFITYTTGFPSNSTGSWNSTNSWNTNFTIPTQTYIPTNFTTGSPSFNSTTPSAILTSIASNTTTLPSLTAAPSSFYRDPVTYCSSKTVSDCSATAGNLTPIVCKGLCKCQALNCPSNSKASYIDLTKNSRSAFAAYEISPVSGRDVAPANCFCISL